MNGIFAGIDIGSSMTKVAILNNGIIVSLVRTSGAEHRKLANKVMEEALEQAKLKLGDITFIVATGYGRVNVPFADKQITEISCHARGISNFLSTARTVVDIGGQDSKVITLLNGKIKDFTMNDRCAAGTGRFLEVTAESIGVTLEKLNKLALQSEIKVSISNTCTVFAAQEIASQLADGASLEDIAAGIFDAIATRTYGLMQKLKVEKDIVITGGGAKNIALVKTLENKVGCPVFIPPEPFLTGAIGAALLGMELSEQIGEDDLALKKKNRYLEEVTFYDS